MTAMALVCAARIGTIDERKAQTSKQDAVTGGGRAGGASAPGTRPAQCSRRAAEWRRTGSWARGHGMQESVGSGGPILVGPELLRNLGGVREPGLSRVPDGTRRGRACVVAQEVAASVVVQFKEGAARAGKKEAAWAIVRAERRETTRRAILRRGRVLLTGRAEGRAVLGELSENREKETRLRERSRVWKRLRQRRSAEVQRRRCWD
ncbi:hypothetical protein Efla_006854 [Eimeria flavescens]